MKHVLVESNWVFQVLEPLHRRIPAATKLLERAAADELTIHLPHVAMKEGVAAIRSKRKRKDDDIREYRRWAKSVGQLDEGRSQVVADFLEEYIKHVDKSLRDLDAEAARLEGSKNVEVFALNDAMLAHVLDVKYEHDLAATKPVDEAILGGVLGRADALLAADAKCEIYFCTTDSDLRPKRRDGSERTRLAKLFSDRQIQVLSDFSVP